MKTKSNIVEVSSENKKEIQRNYSCKVKRTLSNLDSLNWNNKRYTLYIGSEEKGTFFDNDWDDRIEIIVYDYFECKCLFNEIIKNKNAFTSIDLFEKATVSKIGESSLVHFAVTETPDGLDPIKSSCFFIINNKVIKLNREIPQMLDDDIVMPNVEEINIDNSELRLQILHIWETYIHSIRTK